MTDVLNGESHISMAKVRIYDQHAKDLKWLKYFIRKYVPLEYNDILSEVQESNHLAYTGHASAANKSPEKCTKTLLVND